MKHLTRVTAAAALLALVVCAARGGEGEGKPRPRTFRGQVAKVEGDKLTVLQRGDSGETSETFTVGKDTKVLLETADDVKVTVRGEGGPREVVRPKTVAGKLDGLKTGQRVSVQYVDPQQVLEVVGHRAEKRREGGERE